MAELAVVLHGKLGSWKSAASETRPNSTLAGVADRDRAIAERRSFAHFVHDSLWRRVVLANRAAGHRVRVVIHMWNPELESTVNHLFSPAASMYEPSLPKLDKVLSQHLSLKRALGLLLSLPGPAAEVVFATRPDLLVFDDIIVPLQRDALDLWLPYNCVPLRLRLPPPLNKAHSVAMKAACGGGHNEGKASGQRLQPPQLSRIYPPSLKC